MPAMGFEPTVSLGERPQTYALDRAAAGNDVGYNPEKYEVNPHCHVDLEYDRPGPTYVATGLPFQVSLTLLACINIMKTS